MWTPRARPALPGLPAKAIRPGRRLAHRLSLAPPALRLARTQRRSRRFAVGLDSPNRIAGRASSAPSGLRRQPARTTSGRQHPIQTRRVRFLHRIPRRNRAGPQRAAGISGARAVLDPTRRPRGRGHAQRARKLDHSTGSVIRVRPRPSLSRADPNILLGAARQT